MLDAVALLRAFLLRAFCSIRSERRLVERIEFGLLFRRLGSAGPVCAATFTKNHDRLLAGEVAVKFLATVVAHSRVKRLLSGEPNCDRLPGKMAGCLEYCGQHCLQQRVYIRCVAGGIRHHGRTGASA